MRARFLVDRSAWARSDIAMVGDVLLPLLEGGAVATCSVVDLEILHSARSAADYEEVVSELAGLEHVPLSQEVFDRALDIQRRLAATGHHRVPIPDLLIAAAALEHDLAVLHYDADFEAISSVTNLPHTSVAARGSV
ncbi:MAG TPA: PIN domain-containing protein [Acidimicrobiia bacterium]